MLAPIIGRDDVAIPGAAEVEHVAIDLFGVSASGATLAAKACFAGFYGMLQNDFLGFHRSDLFFL